MSKRIWTTVVVAVLTTGLLVAAPSGGIARPERAEQSGRWSGVWEVEGQTQEGGAFVLFGDITFTQLTGDEAEAIRLNFGGTCADTDDVYRMAWEFGGGGAGQACEIGSLEDHLFGDYFGNDGSWGQFENSFGGSTWTGEYSAPSFDPTRPSDLVLQWRGKPSGQCPVSSVARVAACDLEREVRFTFTQGGRPKQGSETLVDVRTVGTGTVTYLVDPEKPSAEVFEVEDVGGKIVREVDYAVDAGTDIKTKQLRLRIAENQKFRFIPNDDSGGEDEDEFASVMWLDLEVVRSSDSRCSAKKDGGPRKARLYLVDESAENVPDAMKLTVPGCPEQNFLFKGKKKVTVAIVRVGPIP